MQVWTAANEVAKVLGTLFRTWPLDTLNAARALVVHHQRREHNQAVNRRARLNKPWSEPLSPVDQEEARLGGYSRDPAQEEF